MFNQRICLPHPLEEVAKWFANLGRYLPGNNIFANTGIESFDKWMANEDTRYQQMKHDREKSVAETTGGCKQLIRFLSL